ncbi:MAG: hypothetical protein SPI55_07290 [Segatella copri]|nr:hypothetical protein [Segatella copri]
MPSDGADFNDWPACAEQPVVDKPTAAKSDKSIFFISCFVYTILAFFVFFLFVLLGRNNLS